MRLCCYRAPDAEAFRQADDGLGTDAAATDSYALAKATLASVREVALPGSIASEVAIELNDGHDGTSDVEGTLGAPDLDPACDRLGGAFRDLVTAPLTGALENAEDGL